MVTLRNPQQLVTRFEKRFARMNAEVQKAAKRRQQDLYTQIQPMFAGQPSGAARTAALRAADYPFATRHGGPLWTTPPIGIISGNLYSSIKYMLQNTQVGATAGGAYTITVKSVGSRAAHWILMPGGTSKMVDRRVIEAARVATQMLCYRTVFELMMTQRGLL